MLSLQFYDTGIILCMRAANERRCYIVTSSPIGWAHTQNDPWWHYMASLGHNNICEPHQISMAVEWKTWSQATSVGAGSGWCGRWDSGVKAEAGVEDGNLACGGLFTKGVIRGNWLPPPSLGSMDPRERLELAQGTSHYKHSISSSNTHNRCPIMHLWVLDV